jgi:ABC-type transporter Mla maintaining outer membrane lipid asymmetry ATPase subunit MlaF
MSSLLMAAKLDRVTVLGDMDRVVLDRVSLSIRPGEALGFIGHNGGGKTTLLRLLAGLLRPTRGRVRVGGLDVSTLDYAQMRDHRTRTGFVFEAGGLWANRTVAENIALPLRYHAAAARAQGEQEIDARVLAVAEELGIAAHLAMPSFRTNASVRKRALVARALILEPSLLLCDEPQVGLTMKEARPVASAIERRRKERDMTVIFADHDGFLDPFVTDRNYYFENGQMLDRPSALPPPDRDLDLGLPASSLGGSSVRGGSIS